MTFGSMIEADQRLRAHEVFVRKQKKLAKDSEVWRRYEQEIEQSASEAADAQLQKSSKS